MRLRIINHLNHIQMDRTLLITGIFTILLGISLVLISYLQSKKTTDNQSIIINIDKILEEIKNIDYYDSRQPISSKLIKVKKDAEQSIGVTCISDVYIRDYEQCVNQFGVKRVINDLESLKLQLKNDESKK